MSPDKPEHPSGDGTARRRPTVVVLDVNETLSDMSPMAARFAEVGLPEHLAATWFVGLLRDGFALTVTGDNPPFAELASDSLLLLLEGVAPDVDAAAAHVMAGFGRLALHPDVVEGVRALRADGLRLATLSNGAATVAQSLLECHGVSGEFERLLSVQDAPAWKPHASAYRYALDTLEVPASDAMLVAVHPWDIHGAHEAGLLTAWLNRAGTRYPRSLQRADLEVGSLTALAEELAHR